MLRSLHEGDFDFGTFRHYTSSWRFGMLLQENDLAYDLRYKIIVRVKIERWIFMSIQELYFYFLFLTGFFFSFSTPDTLWNKCQVDLTKLISSWKCQRRLRPRPAPRPLVNKKQRQRQGLYNTGWFKKQYGPTFAKGGYKERCISQGRRKVWKSGCASSN